MSVLLKTVQIALLVNYLLWKIIRSKCPSPRFQLAVSTTWLKAQGVAPSCWISTLC